MEQDILKIVTKNKNLFVPHLFTNRQVNIMDKYLCHKILNNTEKNYLYSTIKKKIEALRILREEFYINGSNMIPKRVEEAKKILKEINKEKAFISGSFLFKKDYEDIDIYVISKRRKSYHKENKHFIHITEKMLKNPIFISPLRYSVANFSEDIKPEIKREEFNETILIYQWIINQILDKEDQKEIRDLIFNYHLQIKKEVIDSHTLYQKTEEIKKLPEQQRIKKINDITKELLLASYSKTYLYNRLTIFLQELKKDLQESKVHDNILIWYNMLSEVKDECRRAQT
ncbi:MAG: hypothetical protein ABIH82_02770 [Candidatus Woesearchaeota archaeon]